MKHNGSHIDRTYSALQAIHYSLSSDRSSPAVGSRDSIPSSYSAGTWFESRQGPPSVIEGYSKILSVTPLFSKIDPQILCYSFCDFIIWSLADNCHFYSVSNLFTITHNFWYLIILPVTTGTLQPGSDWAISQTSVRDTCSQTRNSLPVVLDHDRDQHRYSFTVVLKSLCLACTCYTYNLTITILGIIRSPVFYLKYCVSETGFSYVFPVRYGQTYRVKSSFK
jgi:hypothetical protein